MIVSGGEFSPVEAEAALLLREGGQAGQLHGCRAQRGVQVRGRGILQPGQRWGSSRFATNR